MPQCKLSAASVCCDVVEVLLKRCKLWLCHGLPFMEPAHAWHIQMRVCAFMHHNTRIVNNIIFINGKMPLTGAEHLVVNLARGTMIPQYLGMRLAGTLVALSNLIVQGGRQHSPALLSHGHYCASTCTLLRQA